MRNYFGFTLLILMLIAIAQSKYTVKQPILTSFVPENTILACNVTVDAGANDTICNAGESVNLIGNISGNYISASWSPTTGLTNPNSPTTTAVVNATTTYTLSVRSINTQNLITNGDFRQGNTGFTTDYQFNSSDVRQEGFYSVTTNGRNVHSSFANCGDHTGGGNMMVVNASGTSDNVWCQTITVQPSTDYLFGAWAASMVSQNPARLQFSINGTLIGNVFQAPSQTCQWTEFTANWTSGASNTAQICIANVNNTPAGNDFAIDDISFRQVCTTTDDVTIALADLSAAWNSPGALCQNSAPIILNTLLDTSATVGGAWTIDGTAATTLDPSTLAVGNHNVLYRVISGSCEAQDEQIVSINVPANAGVATAPPHVCEGVSQTINLADLINGEDVAGSWSETSTTPSSGGAFNANAGTFVTANQAAGTYSFVYTVPSSPPCEDAQTTVNVIIDAAPQADAGADMELNCAVDIVTLGGSETSTGGNFQYQWTAANGGNIALPNIAFTEVEQADTYTLMVTNSDNGCSASDQVTVTSQITSPSAEINVKPVTCNQTHNGAIQVVNAANGEAPFEYSLNGGSFTSKNEFNSLAPGDYTLTVRDQNGCDTTLQVSLAQPEALRIALQADTPSDPPYINQGDTIHLNILVSKPEGAITAVTWLPDTIGCNTCLTATDRPMSATTYQVRVTDENGCVASDQLTVFVQQLQRVFIPNAFSPNGDGENDILYINAAQEVQLVKSFRIMNRWGVMVFSRENFLPNDPTLGWDGSFNGQRIPTGVYVYVAELEMTNGETAVISGDVTLMQ